MHAASHRRHPVRRHLFATACLCVAWADLATASSPPAEFTPGANALTIKTPDAQLTVSTRCPQFAFEQVTVGGDAATRATIVGIADGRPIEIPFEPISMGGEAALDVRLMLQWSPGERVLRKWATFRVTGAGNHGILREITLETLEATAPPASAPTSQGVAHDEGDPQSHPVFLDGFFVGIEFPIATTRAGRGRTILAYRPGLRLTPGTWYESRKAVYGIAAKGGEREAFQQYIAAHRPPPKGLHLNYNSWWTSPVPYSEADILKLLDVIEQKLYRPHGVSFDTFCIDLGWTNPQSLWEIDNKLFPEGFAKIQQAAARMNTRLGLWISPSNHYTGTPGDMNNEWAATAGYETFLAPFAPFGNKPIRFVCLAGERYRTALQERLVEMVARYGIRQFKFDGCRLECPEASHGHAPGQLSADAVADGIIRVFDAIHRAAPDAWLETTCFGFNPSPWWLFHVNSVIGTYGDDAPYGRVPAPVYRESYTTARDCYNLQGAARLPIPIVAQDVLGIIHQSPEPFLNDAVISVMRGHMFQSAYVNPAYMSDARWKTFAALVSWARRNEDALSETQPLLPKAWSNGGVPQLTHKARMPREPYGYAHWNGDGGLVAIRNPWIVPQTFAFKLDAGERRSPAQHPALSTQHSLSVVSLYPQVRLYGQNLRIGDTLQVPLAPYETVVLSISPEPPPQGIPAAGDAVGHRIRTTNVRQSAARVRFEGAPATQPFGPDWTSTVAGMTSGIQWRLEADIEADAPQAEFLVLLEGPKPVTAPLCRLFVDGRESAVSCTGSETGWSASLESTKEHWLFLRAPLTRKTHNIRVELVTDSNDSTLSSWVWATSPPPTNTPGHPNALPSPELISLDGAAVAEPTELREVPADVAIRPCPIERIDGVFLDTMEPVSVSQGWGSLQRNRSAWEKPMTIAGKRFLRGLGTHAPSKIVYSLEGRYRRFQSRVGADAGTAGSVTFEVRLDGQTQWQSDVMTPATAAEQVDLDVTGAQTLELIVGDGGNGFLGDHADWADARLLR